MLHRTDVGMRVSLTGILGFRVADKQRTLHLGVVYKFDFAKFRCQMAQFHWTMMVVVCWPYRNRSMHKHKRFRFWVCPIGHYDACCL